MDPQTFLTVEGKAELDEELRHLKYERRPEIAAKIHEAKESGEMPEGGEFDESKNDQAFIEGRIAEIEDIFKNARIVKDHDRNVVSIGGFVRVRNEKNVETRFNIVGPAEISPENGKISHDSPIAQSLLGKRVGDVVNVTAPAGTFAYTILEVS
jgi:transcription elongation factor GreA